MKLVLHEAVAVGEEEEEGKEEASVVEWDVVRSVSMTGRHGEEEIEGCVERSHHQTPTCENAAQTFAPLLRRHTGTCTVFMRLDAPLGLPQQHTKAARRHSGPILAQSPLLCSYHSHHSFLPSPRRPLPSPPLE